MQGGKPVQNRYVRYRNSLCTIAQQFARLSSIYYCRVWERRPPKGHGPRRTVIPNLGPSLMTTTNYNSALLILGEESSTQRNSPLGQERALQLTYLSLISGIIHQTVASRHSLLPEKNGPMFQLYRLRSSEDCCRLRKSGQRATSRCRNYAYVPV